MTAHSGFSSGAFGVATPQALGGAVQNVSFTPVFAVCAFVHLTAFLGVSALIGRLGEVRQMGAGSR